MKKTLTTIAFLIVCATMVSAQTRANRIEAYYAKKDFATPYMKVKKGDLVAEVLTGDEGYSMIDKGSTYCYHNSYTEEDEFTVPKANVEVKYYQCSPLSLAEVGQCINFVSADGLKARIFKWSLNGHKFIGGGEMLSSTSSYAISVECKTDDGTINYIEDPLDKSFIQNGKILINGYFADFSSPVSNRNKSSYDMTGKLLVNRDCRRDISDYTIGYIGSEKALYCLGKLYYRTEGNTPASETAANETIAAPQCPADLPLDDIFELIDNEIDTGEQLKAAGYKYVGEYADESSRSVIMTWCRNCTANKRGNVLSFQSGTSSIVNYYFGMGDFTTLIIEIFNTTARDAIVAKLKEMGFKEDSSPSFNGDYYTRTTSDVEVSATMEKSKKGWVFKIFPINAQ